MAARDKKKQINLLPQEEFEASLVGRILKWLLSSFRIIVILTEIIVMAAFLSRFWLDARATDLNDEINQKKAVIAASGEFEKEFKDLQSRLRVFSAVTSSGHIASDTFGSLVSYLPDGIQLASYSHEGNTIQVRGVSADERNLIQFIANLEASNLFAEVSLSNLDTDLENPNVLVFTLNLFLKER